MTDMLLCGDRAPDDPCGGNMVANSQTAISHPSLYDLLVAMRSVCKNIEIFLSSNHVNGPISFQSPSAPATCDRIVVVKLEV